MKLIRHCGTIILCGICLIGMLIVLLTTGFYGLKCIDWEGNAVSAWFTQNAAIDWTLIFPDDMAKKYSDADNIVKKYEKTVDNFKSIIDSLCTTSFPQNAEITGAVNTFKVQILKNEINSIPYGNEMPEYISTAIEYIRDFEQYLQDKEIDFLYVSEPERERYLVWSGEKDMADSGYISGGDLFRARLSEEDIDFLDIIGNEEILSNLQFDESGHWMSADALAVTGIIADYLNEKYDYDFNLDIFNQDNYYNILEKYPEKSEEIEGLFGYKYYLYVPIESDRYTLIKNETEKKTGDFAETLLTEPTNWNRLVNDSIAIAYHDMWQVTNAGIYNIVNESTEFNSDKKILILGDSYSWPIASYLSQGVGEIVIYNPGYFSGDVRAYIEAYEPDTVIMSYIDCQVMGAATVERFYGALQNDY